MIPRAPISEARRWLLLFAFSWVLVAPLRAEPPAPGLLQQVEAEVTALHARARLAVVKVHAEQSVQLGDQRLPPYHRVGTGFFVATNGLLLTAATVVTGADRCWIDCAGQQVPARVRGIDRRTNLAALEADPTRCAPAGQPLPVLALHAGPLPKIGTFVVAIGYAYDLPCAPTLGVIQGIEIRQGNNVLATSHLRADCRLKPGQAGAPLLNTAGVVLGLAVAAHGEDQCSALPAAAIARVLADLLAHGQARYSWVGLEVVERQPPESAPTPVEPRLLVQSVCSNSPAAAAGFLPRDQLVELQHRPVDGLADVVDAVFFQHAGGTLEFTVRREGELRQLRVVLGTPPALSAAPPPAAPPLPLTPVSAPR